MSFMNFGSGLFVRQASDGATYNGFDIALSTRNTEAIKKSENSDYAKETARLIKYSDDTGKWWGAGLMGFWVLLVLFAAIEHWTWRFFPNAMMRCRKATANSAAVRVWRKYVTMPALFNRKHTMQNRLGGVIPTRFESIVLFFYFAIVVIGECVGYSYYKHNTIWKAKKVQISKYVGDRAALMTVFMFNTVYLFAGRNNFLLWLTGWKMSTFYAFHKWIGRMTIVSAFVHTITMLISSYWTHQIHKIKYTSWWRWGSVAMVCAGILLLQSVPMTRSRWYDIFLYSHIIFAVFVLIGIWIHCESLGYGKYIYSVAAVWCFDRSMRILRILQFGVRTAHIKLVADEIMVLTIPLSSTVLKKPTPGSFGYIYFLNGWYFFQSHPFSVIQEDNGEIKFLIRSKNGITKRIYRRLLENPEQEMNINVAIEGYYGDYRPVHYYDEVIMIGGGNGVSSLYEYVKDIAIKKRIGKSNVKLLKFYWVIRNWKSTGWFASELIRLEKFSFIKPIVYVTQGDFPRNPPSSHESVFFQNEMQDVKSHSAYGEKNVKDDEVDVFNNDVNEMDFRFSHVEFRASRPNLPQVISDDIQQYGTDLNVCIMSCAHNAICDDVRRIVSFEVGKPRGGRIDLFELLQVW